MKRNYGRGRRAGLTVAVGARYKYELTDIFVGQFALTQFPHKSTAVLRLGCADGSEAEDVLEYTQNYVGAKRYLEALRYCGPREWCRGMRVVQGLAGEKYALSAFPSMRHWFGHETLILRDQRLSRCDRVQEL